MALHAGLSKIAEKKISTGIAHFDIAIHQLQLFPVTFRALTASIGQCIRRLAHGLVLSWSGGPALMSSATSDVAVALSARTGGLPNVVSALPIAKNAGQKL